MGEPQLFFVFDATISRAALAETFLSTGGGLNAASGEGDVDFALTGSPTSFDYSLAKRAPKKIILPVNPSVFSMKDDIAVFNDRIKLLASLDRMGCGIQGSGVSTYAGGGYEYLVDIWKTSGSARGMEIRYGVWENLSSVLLLSNPELIEATKDDGEETDGISGVFEVLRGYKHRRIKPVFKPDEQRDDVLVLGSEVVKKWAETSWKFRQKALYDWAPTLHKTVAKTVAGVADQGYVLVHDIIDQRWGFTLESLNSLMQKTIATELAQDPQQIYAFESETSTPGLGAASHMETVASAISLAVNFMVAYRADGKTQIGAKSSVFGSVESWLRQFMRKPIEANDCDGSAVLAAAILQTIAELSVEERTTFPYLNYIYNVLVPHYTWGVMVLGANAAEAESATGDTKKKSVAGHAIAFVIPVVHLLEALSKGSKALFDGVPLVKKQFQGEVDTARFQAFYSADVIQMLTDFGATGEVETLISGWSETRKNPEFAMLKPYGIEGTTWASPVLWVDDDGDRQSSEVEAKRDSRSFKQLKPHIARGMKMLHVGGHDKKHPHKFYHKFVEGIFFPTNPLYTNPVLRGKNVACTQYVFSTLPSGVLNTAGVYPRDFVTGNFVATPLYPIGTDEATIIDASSVYAKANTMPPRHANKIGPWKLTAFQSKQLKRSLEVLAKLDEKFDKDQSDGHCVQYTFAYATLVSNPTAINQFANRLLGSAGVAVAGMVDVHTIENLAVHPDGEQAGKFVIVNVIVDA